jgi:hypothetical protein
MPDHRRSVAPGKPAIGGIPMRTGGGETQPGRTGEEESGTAPPALNPPPSAVIWDEQPHQRRQSPHRYARQTPASTVA